MKKQKFSSYLLVAVIGVIVMGFSVFAWVKPADEFSDSERRNLALFPDFTFENILATDFMTDFEEYTLDQFPLRDWFRSVKVFTELKIFNKQESNDLYLEDGYIGKIEAPMNEALVNNAADKFLQLYDMYLADANSVYLSIIPDKSFFLAEANGYPSMDYELLRKLITDKTTGKMEYIDIYGALTIDDYYKTDTHWKQESIIGVADILLGAMDAGATGNYTVNKVDGPFHGVYYGQLGLPAEADELVYLTNDTINSCIVTSYDTGMPKPAEMYDMAAATGKDPYEIFVCGADALVTIENPNAATDRELVIFRDSFCASIAPLMCESYAKITLVDIRYMMPAAVGHFADFENADVLFLYSTLVLNNSSMFK